MTRQLTIFFIIILSFFISCDSDDQKKITENSNDSIRSTHTINDRGMPMETLESKVLEDGDIEAYDDLMIELLDYSNEERIKWAKIMADKHHYVRAYTDVFEFILIECNPNFTCLSESEKEIAITYLNKALEKGDSLAIELKKEYNIK
jgi:hypothetical protein